MGLTGIEVALGEAFTLEQLNEFLNKENVEATSTSSGRKIKLITQKTGGQGTLSVNQILDRFEYLISNADDKNEQDLQADVLLRIMELDADASKSFAINRTKSRMKLAAKQLFNGSNHSRFESLIKGIDVPEGDIRIAKMKIHLAARKAGKNHNMSEIIGHARRVIDPTEENKDKFLGITLWLNPINPKAVMNEGKRWDRLRGFLREMKEAHLPPSQTLALNEAFDKLFGKKLSAPQKSDLNNID